MSTRSVHPPWEYLRHASVPALQSFELSRLNHAADLRKEIDTLLDQWLDETAAALLARFLIDEADVPDENVRGRSRRAISLASGSTSQRCFARYRGE
jgi:hypothetical protein